MNDLIKLLREKSASDPRLRSIIKRIENGAADFSDTAKYSEKFSKLLGKLLSENVLGLSAEDRESVCEALLKASYDEQNALLAQVQTALDEKNGIKIRPQKASFPAERVQQLAHSLVDPTVPDETIQRRANSGTANISMSFHDDYMKENAEFRNDAGLKCYITRMGTGCCSWCSEVAGRFRFGDQPNDIFRRHDNCDCTIIYDNKVLRGQRSADGGRTKTWEQIGEVPKDYQPTVFTQEQAKAIEQRNLQYIGLTNGGENDIIESGIQYLDSKPRLEKHGIDECYNTTNPNYNTGEEFKRNCQRCVVAYEARRRGFDVIAKPASLGDEPLKKSYGSRGWTNVFENGEKNFIPISGTNVSEIEKNIRLQMESYGDGARVAIKVSLGRNKGHVFIAEQVKGQTIFIDPQIGDNNCSYWFMEGMIIPENTRLLRIDDKKFTNLIEECVQ